MRASLGALLLVAAALPGGCDDAANPEEWSRPYEGHLPGTDWDRFAILLVRDVETGLPIAGAAVRRHPEMLMGDGEWAPRWETATTDEHGLAWIDLPKDIDAHGPEVSHWVVDAPGYAPTEEYGRRVGEVVDLERGTDRRGRVLDVFGRPAAGIVVEYKRGCAHGPALRRAVTDKDGVFSFAAIADGDLCLDGPGLLADYPPFPDPRPSEAPPETYDSRPGGRVTGRIVGREAGFLAHAVVKGETNGRGPLARVQADGAFTLEGADLEGSLRLVHEWEENVAELVLAHYRPGGPILWDLGPVKPDAEPVTVRVRVLDERSGAPVAPADVHFDRVTDGRRWSFHLDAPASSDTVIEAQVPEGSYHVSVGHPFARWVAPEQPVEAAPDRYGVLDLIAHEQPRLQVVVRRPEADDSELVAEVCLADRSEPLTPADEQFLPALVPAVVRYVRGRGDVLRFAVEPAAEGRRRVVIDLPPAKVIRFTDPGEDARASLNWSETDIDRRPGGAEITTWSSGRESLFVRRVDGATARLDVALPAESGGVVDLGVLPFVAVPGGIVHVVDSAGQPLKAGLTWPHVDPVTLEPFRDAVESGEDGDAFLAYARPGTVVQVDGEGLHVRYARLEGNPPWTVRFGSAALEVVVRADDGPIGHAGVLLGGVLLTAQPDEEEGAPEIFRALALDPGPHVLVVGAWHRTSRIMRVVLKEGEMRKIEVVLPKRP